MRKLKLLTEFLASATLVLLGHTDTASAQLVFSPSPVQLSISGPGFTAGPQSVTVSPVSGSLTISNINTTSGGNWLCAVVSGSNTLNIYIGAAFGSCVPTTSSQLAANQNYTGTINVRDASFQAGTLTVNLSVGNGSGTGAGVVASPPSVSFVASPGGQVGSQPVTVTYNGSLTNISSSPTFTPTSGGVNFLSTAISGPTATLSVPNTNLAAGTYSGILTLNTIFGSVNVQVTLTIGGGGGGGVVATPSSVSFNATPGGQAVPQTVSVTVNGLATSINNASFTPTPPSTVSFVSAAISGSTAILSVNNTSLGAGVYAGTETLSTIFGSVNVPVTLTVSGSTGGLIVNPNPVNFTLQINGNAPSQNVTVTLPSSTPVLITGISSTTNTGQNWLILSIPGAPGVVNVGVNGFVGPSGSFLSSGTYTGTVTVNTSSGLTTFQVNLTVGGIPTLQTNPTALNFAFQAGTAIPAPQTIAVTSSGTPINFTVSSSTSSGFQWLIVSPTGQSQQTPGTITVSVQPAGLQGGVTYSGNIQINTFGGSTNTTVNVPVNLVVSSSPILSVSPASLNFTAQAGISPAAQILTIQSSSVPLSYSVTSSVTTPPGFNWLQVPVQTGATQGTVSVGVVTAGLPTGIYNGTVTVTAPNSGNFSVSVPVTLTITAGAVLQLTPASLSFAYQIGQLQAQPPNQTITVASTTGPVGITASAQTTSGGNWLSVSPATGAAPGSIVASVNPSGAPAGTHNATITVTPSNGPTQTIPVTLVVSASALLVTSPSNVTFSVQQGATSSSFQNLAVTSTDGTLINFNVAVAYTSAGTGWLFLNSSTGVTPSNLTITANPLSLGLGTYTATLTLTATSPANVANSPQVINVTLNVTPSATLAVSPALLSFTQTAGGAAPASQNISVTSSSGTLTFAASATTNQGGGWLLVSPSNGTTPGTLTVSVSGAGLPASPTPYTGQIVISSPGSSNPQVTVSVSLVVSSAVTINVSPAALSPVNFQIGGPNPGTQTATVSIAGGGLATFTAVASTITGGNWLSVSPSSGTTPGNVVVTVNPAGLPASTIPYQGSVSIAIAGATNSPVNLPITLTVSPAAQITPSVAGVQNAGSYLSSSISPGLVILIYGANMGPATLVSYNSASGFVATNLSDTQVTFDGILAPIVFTRNDVVSVIVPYEIGGRASVSMIVSYKGAGSTPIQLRVVDAAPAIFTLSQTGTGQGAILNQNGTVNGAGNPEVVGNVIQIFATGEGLTTPRGITGSINPSRLPLPAPVLPITVTIGGRQVPAADIFYAGEAPSNPAGVIQINAKIPVGVGSGQQQVFFTVGGVPSQGNVTVSVR